MDRAKSVPRVLSKKFHQISLLMTTPKDPENLANQLLSSIFSAFTNLEEAVGILSEAKQAGILEAVIQHHARTKNLQNSLNNLKTHAVYALIWIIEVKVNDDLKREVADRSDELDYEKKKQLVRDTNSKLREYGAAVAVRGKEGAWEPSVLLAVGSPDGCGRYVLENRITKKRTNTCKSLLDILPLTLTSDIPRYVERNRSGQGNKTED